MSVRRDPRAERQARRVAGGERPRFVLAPASQPATGRRAVTQGRSAAQRRLSPALRPRIDWQAGRAGTAKSALRADAAQATPQSQIRVIADPAFLVLAVPDHPGGALSDHDRELIGAARQFAGYGRGAVVVLTMGGVGSLDQAGVDRVVTLPAREGSDSTRKVARRLCALPSTA